MTEARDRTTAPAEYLVLDSPNEAECGALCCPHEGCDGFVFDTIAECHTHEDEWHSGPYICAHCETKFAAQPALMRHVHASDHKQWPCREEGCSLYGAEFSTPSSYLVHLMNSKVHQKGAESDVNTQDTKNSKGQHGESSDELSDCGSHFEQMCLEVCCSRYRRLFTTELSYRRHTESFGHTEGVAAGKKLQDTETTGAEMEAKQEALRGMICDDKGCLMYEHQFSTSQSYYYHLETLRHQRPTQEVAPMTASRLKSPFPKVRCEVQQCSKYKHEFKSLHHYKVHAYSSAHTHAVANQTLPNEAFSDAAPITSIVTYMLKYSPSDPIPHLDAYSGRNATSLSADRNGSSNTALASESHGTPGLSRKEESLTKKNQELEVRVLQLEGEMAVMRVKHEERMAGLLGMLSDVEV